MDKNKCPNSKLKKKFIKNFPGRFLHLAENVIFINFNSFFLLFSLLSRNETTIIK